ncbi:outer membrane protein [Rhizobium straminoryzae]|uniref:Porin family protein n=1 Tax=Rhizobium straminoryzae TaxID=1387186 RepID=A0A549TB60_9HYPH|nr:outer membrane beta-barrel protein [Rhizobium straminoryzae]TRL39133.1 porin family protein [Rhizobium straminoryzae]
MILRNAIHTAALLAGCLFVSAAQAGDFEISGYGGWQSAPHSHVDVSDQPGFGAGWEGKSFASPPYWGIRGTYWFDGGALSNLGISLDYTHDKVYADDETMAKAGWSHFEFTDGLNILTLNALYRFPLQDLPITPYVGAGVGINVPHVEVTRPSGKTFDYQFGGATIQAQAGVSYRFTDNWSAFLEYKGTYNWIDVDIDSNASLKTDIITHAVNFGVSYKF